jgi:hypothetical protein
MSYTPEEVDGLVANLEKRIEKLQVTLNSSVKRDASERDVLAAAAEIRNLLKKAVANDKAHLNAVFGGECERIGRIRYALDVVEFSDMHEKDCRWNDLDKASTIIEEVLKGLGVYKPWKPTSKGVGKIERKASKTLTLDQQVVMKPEVEGCLHHQRLEVSVLDTTIGIIGENTVAETPEMMPASPEITQIVATRNDAAAGSLPVLLEKQITPGSKGKKSSFWRKLLEKIGGTSPAPKGFVHPTHQLSDKSAANVSADIRCTIGKLPGTCRFEPTWSAGLEVDPEKELWELSVLSWNSVNSFGFQ